MDITKTVQEGKNVCNTNTEDVTQDFSYESYLKWKTEAPYRSICSSRDVENNDMKLAQSSIRLLKKMNRKVCWMWNSAGGFLAFNPKDFHVMVTEHYWASCYENIYKARENFEESWKKKCETIYVCPNIFNIQDTSEKVLSYLSSSLEYLKELEALLTLHSQRPENNLTAIERSPILGIDKDKPVYWTVSHDIVYFQICNFYLGNIIKERLQRMDNFFLLLRAIDSIDFWTELSENSKKISSQRNELNEAKKIVSKPQKLKIRKPGLPTISEELPSIRRTDSSVSKLFRRLKSHSRCSSSSELPSVDIIGSSENSKNWQDTSVMMSMEPLINDLKHSADFLAAVADFEKPVELSIKKPKILPSSQMLNKSKLFKFSRKPIAFILQKIRKNAKSFDSISVAKLAGGTKGLI